MDPLDREQGEHHCLDAVQHPPSVAEGAPCHGYMATSR
jgi:hypothetical protein